MNLYGDRVILRAMELEDMELLLEGINNPELERLIVGWSYPTSKLQQTRWYEKIMADRDNCRFMIQLINGPAIGICMLEKFDWKNRSVETGMKIIDESFRGKGFGLEVEKILEKYVFEELQMNRMVTTILDYNEASQTLYLKKCGWTHEGTMRQAIFKENQYHDLLLVSLLKEDYRRWKKEAEAVKD